jgi:hypothetical protein
MIFSLVILISVLVHFLACFLPNSITIYDLVTIVSISNFCRLYMKSKYGSELWFQGRSLSQCISAKDDLKFYLTKPLETLLVSKDSLPSTEIS